MRFYLTAPRFASDSLPRYTKNNAHSPLRARDRSLPSLCDSPPPPLALQLSGKLAQLSRRNLTSEDPTPDPVSNEIYAVAKFMTSAKFMTLTLIYDPNPNPNPIPCEILDACADSPIVINFAQHRRLAIACCLPRRWQCGAAA